MSDIRGAKRSAAMGDGEPGKRRNPYTLRACDACRKRKGKCRGGQPCEFCAGRDQPCHFASLPVEWRDGLGPEDAEPERSSVQHLQVSQPMPNDHQTLGSLTELVATLQGQLNSLAAQVRQAKEVNGVPARDIGETTPGTRNDSFAFTQASSDTAACGSLGSQHGEFYGPTSPDYSLNVAQMKLRQGSGSGVRPERPKLASLGDEQSEEDDYTKFTEQGGTALSLGWMANLTLYQRLLSFRNHFNAREAVRLLLVYKEVVGEYHPILDMDKLVKQIEGWYGCWPNSKPPASLSAVEQNDLLVTNLAISIALWVESTSPGSHSADLGDAIFASCRDMINARISSPAPSLMHVVITLLVGILHFYKDMTRFAWRMCGVAGRTLMELGLHNQDISRHILGSDQQWTEYSVITISIIVLDRQWSASTGLPTHFTNTDFDIELRSSVNNPYLKAMTSFILISDKLGEPIARVAKGGVYDDDDEFDIMLFQIEQWRKKAVGSYGIPLVRRDQTPSSLPPAWAILLYLRANSVRGMLLRPFFFSSSPTVTGKRNIAPGLDLVTDSIDVLAYLDKTTNIYQRHHPYFQHLLASSCALLFLIIAYIEQNRGSLLAELSGTLLQSISRNFGAAYSLASAYSKSSRASRRLWKRLVQMKKLLAEVGILQAEDLDASSRLINTGRIPDMVGSFDGTTYGQQSTSRAAGGDADCIMASASMELECGQPFSLTTSSPSDSIPALDPQELSVDWAATVTDEWSSTTNGLFWGI